MPHATNETPVVNGEKRTSQFLDHVTSLPVVADSITTFKSNHYGKKSLELADNAYTKFGKPVEPYLETPKSYISPYAKKADELADSGLSHVETRFPIVKEDTHTIIDSGKSIVWWPFKIAGEGKDYVINTYNDEYTKTASHKSRGPGLWTTSLALISTELKLASDFFQAIADFLGPKYEASKQKGSEYVHEAQETAQQYKQMGIDTAEKYKQMGQEKAEQYSKVAGEKGEQVKGEANKVKEEAKKQTQGQGQQK